MMGCGIRCDKKIKGSERKRCCISLQTHKVLCLKVKGNSSETQLCRLSSLFCPLSEAPLPTWLIATNLRHLSWWLKKEHCNVKHLDIWTWGKGKRGKLAGDSFYWTGSWELMSGSLLPSNKSALAFSRQEKSFRSLYKLRWICSSELWHHKFLYADSFNMQVLIKAISGEVMKRSGICQPHRDEKQDWQRCWQDSMGCFMSTLVETNGRQRQHKLPQS